jgi:hypothetical protein
LIRDRPLPEDLIRLGITAADLSPDRLRGSVTVYTTTSAQPDLSL